jgi:serine/threonine-protein kinase
MAPEQLFSEGHVDERSDVWAFGVILYECIAGRRPFAGPSVGQVLRLIALDEYTPLERAATNGPPPTVCDLVARLLARERSLRPRTMREVEGLMRAILDGSYEYSGLFPSPMRSPAARTLEAPVDPALSSFPPADAPLSTTHDSAGLRPAAFLPGRRPWALPVGIAAVVVSAALIGAVSLRPPPSSATAPSAPAEPLTVAPASAARVAAPSTTTAQASAAATSTTPAAVIAPIPISSEATQAKPVAARLVPPPRTAPRVDAAAPAASAAPSAEPARRPGSVVDVPPF